MEASEKRDLATGIPEVRIDMGYVCPKDVKKMLVQQARSVHWKKWAAKHEYEELKEGIWLEPALALLCKKTKEEWTEKTSNCCEEDIYGRRLGAEKTLRHWLVGCKYMPSLPPKGRQRTAQTPPLPRMVRSTTGDSRSLQKVGAKSENLKEGVEVAKGVIMTHPLSESQLNRGHFDMTKWEFEKHRS